MKTLHLIVFAAVLCPLWAACLPVQGEAILAEHLASAIPVFGHAAGKILSPAPLAGALRSFSRSELLRAARRLGLPEAGAADWPTAVCFAHAMAPLTSERLIPAIRQAAGDGQAFEILAYSRYPVPDGELRFKNVSLRPDRPDGSRLLSGGVVYAAGRQAPIWVRVRSLAKPTGLVAAQELRPGMLLDQTHFRLAELDPAASGYLTAPADLVGLTPRRMIASGTPLKPGMMRRPRDIGPGETVTVKVRSGSASLALESEAVSGGDTGDLIVLRNIATGAKFRARVDGRAHASLNVAARENSCCQ